MTSPNEAGFVKLPNERILFTSPPRTHLQISTPNTYSGTEPFSAKSDAGVVYITNQRVRKAFQNSWTSTNNVVDSLPTFDLHPRAPILLCAHTQPPRYLRTSTILWCQLLGRTLQTGPRRWHPTQQRSCRATIYLPRRRSLRFPLDLRANKGAPTPCIRNGARKRKTECRGRRFGAAASL